MNDIYQFVSGPLTWAAFIVFFGGCLYRLISLLYLVYKKEKFIFSYMSWKYSLRSIVHWLTPFGTVNWRKRPVLTVVTFVFHISLIVAPLFFLAHIIMLEEAIGVDWPALPNLVIDVMTVLVVAGCLYFLVRRITQPEVRFVTYPSDYVILHVIAGQVMLVAIPFTRLSHMIFSPLTRAYMGSEFGKVRHARDW